MYICTCKQIHVCLYRSVDTYVVNKRIIPGDVLGELSTLAAKELAMALELDGSVIHIHTSLKPVSTSGRN